MSRPSSFFNRSAKSFAVIEPKALPVSPVWRMNVTFSLPIRRARSSASFNSRASRSARFAFKLSSWRMAARRHFIGFAGRQEKIARVTAAHFHDISLGAKAGDVFGQNNLSRRHEIGGSWMFVLAFQSKGKTQGSEL